MRNPTASHATITGSHPAIPVAARSGAHLGFVRPTPRARSATAAMRGRFPRTLQLDWPVRRDLLVLCALLWLVAGIWWVTTPAPGREQVSQAARR